MLFGSGSHQVHIIICSWDSFLHTLRHPLNYFFNFNFPHTLSSVSNNSIVSTLSLTVEYEVQGRNKSTFPIVVEGRCCYWLVVDGGIITISSVVFNLRIFLEKGNLFFPLNRLFYLSDSPNPEVKLPSEQRVEAIRQIAGSRGTYELRPISHSFFCRFHCRRSGHCCPLPDNWSAFVELVLVPFSKCNNSRILSSSSPRGIKWWQGYSHFTQ